jgi:hypothetical protein
MASAAITGTAPVSTAGATTARDVIASVAVTPRTAVPLATAPAPAGGPAQGTQPVPVPPAPGVAGEAVSQASAMDTSGANRG